MKISFDPEVDALYIRFVEGAVECEVLQINDRVTLNIGAGEQVVGMEVLDASQVLDLSNQVVDRNRMVASRGPQRQVVDVANDRRR